MSAPRKALIPILVAAALAGVGMAATGALTLAVDLQAGLFLLVDGGAMTVLVVALLIHWLRRRA